MIYNIHVKSKGACKTPTAANTVKSLICYDKKKISTTMNKTIIRCIVTTVVRDFRQELTDIIINTLW